MKKPPKAWEPKVEIDQGLHLPFSHWTPKATCTAPVTPGDTRISHTAELSRLPTLQPFSLNTVSPPHMNLQDVNFQRCKHAFHQRQERVELQLALHLLSLTILQLCHLLPPLPPPVSSSSCQFTRCQTQCQLVYWTTVLFKVPYCRIKNDFFNFLCIFLCYYLCGKYYKPITVQCHIVNCVS